jgi:hypothetical protein
MKRCVIIAIFICGLCVRCSAQSLDWVHTQGPYATNIMCFASSGNTLYAGAGVGLGAGLYRSTDNGLSWTLVVTGYINDIETSGSNIYLGGSAGVTVSSDNGASWLVRDTLLPLLATAYSIKKSGTTLYACLGSDGFFSSTSDGKNWTSPIALSGRTINKMIISGNTILLASSYGIMISTNNGTSWTEETGEISNHTINAFTKIGTTIYAGTEAGIYRSLNGGASWNSFGSGIGSDVVISCMYALNETTIFAGTADGSPGAGIYRSTDTGNTWQLINSGLPNLALNSIYSFGTQIFSGTTLSISRSTNTGDSWQTSSAGLPKPVITSVGAVYSVPVVGSSGSYVFTSNDKGGHWSNHSMGLTRPNVTAVFTSGQYAFAGTDAAPKIQKGGLHRSSDYGMTWTQLTKGIPVMPITSIAATNTKIYVSGDSGVFVSGDNGDNWSKFTSDLPTSLYVNNGVLYEVLKFGLYKYTEGAGWTTISTGFLDSSIHSVAVIDSKIFIATDSGVYCSPDNGGVWVLVTGDTLHVKTLWENGILLVAGTTNGMYISPDGGMTWQFQQSLGQVSIHAIGYGHVNLYAGTDSGVYQSPFDQYGVRPSDGHSLVLRTTNPVSNLMKIHYEIPERSNVRLSVADLLGRVQATIATGEIDGGAHDVTWDASSLPSGSYVILLRTDSSQVSAAVNIIR